MHAQAIQIHARLMMIVMAAAKIFLLERSAAPAL
jgi:hypothetical protein